MSNEPQQPPQPYPPYYQPPAQQPAPRASSNPLAAAFWHNMSTAKVSVLTVVATLLLVTVCVVPCVVTAHLASLYQPSRSVFGLPLPSDATTTPTRPPQPLSGATLGGAAGGFLAKLGRPSFQLDGVGGRTWFSFTLANGTTAHVCYCGGGTGSDGTPHLDFLSMAAPSGTTWSDQQGVSIARQFFPPDAKHVRDFTDRYLGLTHVYVSAALAATFPAGEFREVTDFSSSQQAPPGTFSIVCGQHGPPQCGIITGDYHYQLK